MYKTRLSSNSLHVQEIHSRSATLTARNMEIYRIENVGNCCWQIFSRQHFRGETEKIIKNQDKPPKIPNPTTAKVVDC
jgi:hypothetical protein